MANTVKRIKLHVKYRQYVHRPSRSVPWLNVNGLWLERAGFCVGRPVEIEVEERRLIIKAL